MLWRSIIIAVGPPCARIFTLAGTKHYVDLMFVGKFYKSRAAGSGRLIPVMYVLVRRIIGSKGTILAWFLSNVPGSLLSTYESATEIMRMEYLLHGGSIFQ